MTVFFFVLLSDQASFPHNFPHIFSCALKKQRSCFVIDLNEAFKSNVTEDSSSSSPASHKKNNKTKQQAGRPIEHELSPPLHPLPRPPPSATTWPVPISQRSLEDVARALAALSHSASSRVARLMHCNG